MQNPPELITAAQVAERYGIQRRNVSRWAATGKLPAIHKGEGVRGAYMFLVADVEAVLGKADAA